ncbi:MAG: hypothetical protein C0631_04235 [Sedimenticola sp.]|jgi:hypothetical protein|nr:MAG: hypothetical protein C0631_04235 [Sedimenticola sp.]
MPAISPDVKWFKVRLWAMIHACTSSTAVTSGIYTMQRLPKWRIKLDPLTLLIMLVGVAFSATLLAQVHLLGGIVVGG